MKKYALILLSLMVACSASAVELSDYLGKTEIHGFVSQGYLKSDDNDFYFAKTEDGTMQFNEIGINFVTPVTDRLRVGIQFLSRDLGQLGNNEIEIDWAYADYRFRNWLGLRAGKIKRPLGLYNRIRDIDAARTFVMLPTMIYDDVPRETYSATTGIGIYGYLPYGLFYEFQYGTIQMDKDGGTAANAGWLLNTPVVDIDAEETYTAHLEWETPLEGLRLAGSATYFETTVDIALGGLDAEMTNFFASAEYYYDRITIAVEYRNAPLEIKMNDAVLSDQTLEGWYISASYQFADWFTLGGYYGELYPDKDDRNGDSYRDRGMPAAIAWRKDLALTTRFDVNEFWNIKLEGHMMDGLAQVTTQPDEASHDWFLFAAKMTFSF